MQTKHRALIAWFVGSLLLACVSCSRPPPANLPLPKELPPPPAKMVTISAAASTKEVIETLTADFHKSTGSEVQVNPGASSALANQIIAGGHADLFLSANQQWADEVTKAGLAEKSVKLLTNKLVIVVPKGNPGEVKSPQDLLSEKVKKIALAGEKVPAGMYADQALAKLDLATKLNEAQKIARGQDVRATLAYVERGEVEAGIVYSTDVAAAKDVEQVYEFEPSTHDPIVYVLVLLKGGAKSQAVVQFYEHLQSADAEAVYAGRKFERIKADSAVVQP